MLAHDSKTKSFLAQAQSNVDTERCSRFLKTPYYSEEHRPSYRHTTMISPGPDVQFSCSTHLAAEACYGLLLPSQLDAPKPALAPLHTELLELSRLVRSHHHAFRFPGHLQIARLTWEKAMVEIIAVRKCFPAVREDRRTILAMTAWFHLLCVIDDEIEQTDSPTRTSVLAMAIKTLQGRIAGHPERLAATVKLSSGREEMESGECQSVEDLRILALVKSFIDQCEVCLSSQALSRVFTEVIDYLDALSMEAVFPDRTESPDTAADYLSLRLRTIGVSPFFVILECYLLQRERGKHEHAHCGLKEDNRHGSSPKTSGSSSGISTFWTSELHTRFRDSVKCTIGLQNDIVGLAKDLETGDRMNLALLLSDCQNKQSNDLEAILAARSIVIATHNTAMQAAMDCLAHTKASETSHAVHAYVDSLMTFTRLFFKWATHTSRYRLKDTPSLNNVTSGLSECTDKVVLRYKAMVERSQAFIRPQRRQSPKFEQ